MIETPGLYTTVDGLTVIIQEWNKKSHCWSGYVNNCPSKGGRYYTNWLDNGTEVKGTDELALDLEQ